MNLITSAALMISGESDWQNGLYGSGFRVGFGVGVEERLAKRAISDGHQR